MLSIQDHIAKAIATPSIQSYPWPHIEVSNIFPDDFYEFMLNSLPDPNGMEFMNTRSKFRRLLWLEKYGDGDLSDIPAAWTYVRSQIWPVLYDSLCTRFEIKPSFSGGELVYDTPGYHLDPHTDLPERMLTGLMYLARDDTNPGEGTILFSSDISDPFGRRWIWDGRFKPVKSVSYLPNTALFFLRTDNSFHGVRKTLIDRWTLSFDLFR